MPYCVVMICKIGVYVIPIGACVLVDNDWFVLIVDNVLVADSVNVPIRIDVNLSIS